MPVEVLHEVMSTLKYVVDLYKEKLGIDAVQIISSNGKVAQQDVFHSHWHIAPRYPNDGQDVNWKLYPEMINECRCSASLTAICSFFLTASFAH